MRIWTAARLAWTASRVERRARAEALPGMDFHRFGRSVGRRLLIRGVPEAWAYYVAPVSSVRYFEFPFVRDCLGARAGRCLDVSSPRLFSLFAAAAGRCDFVRVINPDAADAASTVAIAAALGLQDRMEVAIADVSRIRGEPAAYDAAWSISVLEHIDGEYTDRDAVRWMWEALRPGGRLMVTVPVDRAFRVETRAADPYGTQRQLGSGQYFFQRFYDAASLRERISDAIGAEPTATRWFGERVPGSYAEYERRWMEQGLEWTVRDALEMRERFVQFPSWVDMPGMGVCGLMFRKG